MLTRQHARASSPLKRASFTSAQKREAEGLGFITGQDRVTRRAITAHAIDNVRPEVKADRDDAIYVDTTPRGDGYLVETTIADVAGTVPLDSPLAAVGHTRAYTRYREFWNDPMFPKYLEDRMSLEHGKQRRGLTVRSWRDKRFETTHLEFERTLSIGDNVDYAMAQERINNNDEQFLLMQKIGKGLRARMKRMAPEAIEEARHDRGGHLPEQQFQTKKMVEAYMLSANEDVATFMAKAQLPYIFRNYEDNNVDADGVARAYYAVRSKRHDALRREGLSGDYGHFTSPIRRGADFYNAHMVHYVIDGIEAMEQSLVAAVPTVDAQKLHHALWRHAPAMFALQGKGSQGFVRQLSEMKAHLASALPEGIEVPPEIIRQFLKQRPPLSHGQLERYVMQINDLVAMEQRAGQAPDIQRWQKEREAQRNNEDAKLALAGLTREQISARSNTEFSQLLRNAATQGVLNEALADEAMARLKLGEESAAIGRRLTQDAFSILIVAPQNSEWLPLRRAACTAIKNSPEAVNGVIELAQQDGHLQSEALHLSRAELTTGHDAAYERSDSIKASLLTYRLDDGIIVAPPYYSVGHNVRSATSHANYSFLECYAFGELRPVEQANIPNLLYADLEQPQADRDAIVEKMANEIGAKFRVVEFIDRQGVKHARAIVKGGGFGEPLIGYADSDESADPAASATRRLLRQEAFKDALNFPHLEQLRSELRPLEKLAEKLAEIGKGLDEKTQPEVRGLRNRFRTTITVPFAEGTRTYLGIGPNMDRARHDAATKALEDLGWAERTKELRAKSWVADTVPGATNPSSNAR